MKNVFSIRYKIFIIYSLLIICILLFTSVITNQMTSNTSVENAVETSERELALIINNLDAKITHIYDYATTVAVNPDVIAMLKKYKTPPQTASAQYQLRTTLSKSVNSSLSVKPSENAVFSRHFAYLVFQPYVFSLVFALTSRNKGKFFTLRRPPYPAVLRKYASLPL